MEKFDINAPCKNCRYNPSRDVESVSQQEVISIADAFVNGLIPDNVIAQETEFDGNENPESIIGRPANEFEALHLSETVKNLRSASKQKEE